MGCDYFIVKSLDITYEDGISSIELERTHEYYPPYDNLVDIDSDDDGYQEERDKAWKLYREQCAKCLEVKRKPILIYKENKFVNDNVKNKYYDMVVKQCDDDDNKIDVIKTIYKTETRYER